MGLLQDIADAIGNEKLKQFQAGQADFDEQSSADQRALENLIKRMDPKQLQEVLTKSSEKIDSHAYAEHVTPGAADTDPLGQLKSGGLESIASVLLDSLKHFGSRAGSHPGKIPGVVTSDPKEMNVAEVAAVARYTQQNHPEAFGRAAAALGREQPGLLHSFLGKAAMASIAAALASHFIKMDRKTPK